MLASLEDGTPLVTGRALGDGRVVLFHVTASADWSSLPLSGLFVQMLERLTQSAGGLAAAPETLAGTVWTPLQVLDGFGALEPPSLVAGVPGERLAEARPSPETPPGIYASGERRVALNVMRAGRPAGAARRRCPRAWWSRRSSAPEEIRLGPWLIALALVLLALDVLATLVVSGRLGRGLRAAARGRRRGARARRAGARRPAAPRRRRAGRRRDALYAANQTVLAYVETGNPRVDAVSARRARRASAARSSTAPRSSRPTRWRSTSRPTTSRSIRSSTGRSPRARRRRRTRRWRKLNDFLRFGGMILFDTQDADLGGSVGGTTPNGRALQRHRRASSTSRRWSRCRTTTC